MSLENKLAKNMIRFGVKNLSEHSNQKLTLLSEQLKIKWKKGKFKFWGSSGTVQQTVDPVDWQARIETLKDDWDEYLTDNEQSMTKKMNSTSLTHWDEIKSNPETKGYAVASLEQRYVNRSQTQTLFPLPFCFRLREALANVSEAQRGAQRAAAAAAADKDAGERWRTNHLNVKPCFR